MQPLHPPYDAAADAAHAAWAAVRAANQGTVASVALSAVTIGVAIAAIWNSSRLQNNARAQHLSAAAIGIAHALAICGRISELLRKHPQTQRANTRALLNMCKPARVALEQILSNAVDDAELYQIGVNLQTTFIVFTDEVSYADTGVTSSNSNADMLLCLSTLVGDLGPIESQLSLIRARHDASFRRYRKRTAVAARP